MPVQYTVQKGDTLNDISQRFGYKNYKEAGITSVPSGNFDLIRPGETISINDSRVPGFGETTPVISSRDSSQQFKSDSDKLDQVLNPQTDPNADQNADPNAKKTDLLGDKVTTDAKTGLIKTGDAVYDKLQENAFYAKENADKQAEEVKREYESLFGEELRAINSSMRAAIDRTQQTFSQRIEEQKKINKLNVDRVKAYGLAYGQAMTTPIEWSDAVTDREREGARVVGDLQTERDNLIAAARAARDEGRADLLESKLKNVRAVEDKLEQKLQQLEKDSRDQYELLQKMRKEQETEFKQRQAKTLERMRAYFQINSDDIANMTPEEKDKKVQELANKYGLEYYEVFSVIEEALAPDLDAMEAKLKRDKLSAEIDATKALKGQRDASAASSWASAAKTKKETEKLNDVKDNGAEFTDQEKRKLEQAGLSNSDRQTQLNYLYGDDIEQYDAKNSASDGDLESRATGAGYDYGAMRAAGYSDDEIKAALDAAGV